MQIMQLEYTKLLIKEIIIIIEQLAAIHKCYKQQSRLVGGEQWKMGVCLRFSSIGLKPPFTQKKKKKKVITKTSCKQLKFPLAISKYDIFLPPCVKSVSHIFHNRVIPNEYQLFSQSKKNKIERNKMDDRPTYWWDQGCI